MSTVTVSDKGQVVIPADIRRALGIVPGARLEFRIDDHGIRAEVLRTRVPTRLEDGIGMLSASRADRGSLLDFDVAKAMKLSARPKASRHQV